MADETNKPNVTAESLRAATSTPAPKPPAGAAVPPKTPTPEEQSRKAEEMREKYLAAVKAMDDSQLRDRVVSVHPYAGSSDEGIKAMQEDYKRLAEQKAKEEEVAKAGEVKPVGTGA